MLKRKLFIDRMTHDEASHLCCIDVCSQSKKRESKNSKGNESGRDDGARAGARTGRTERYADFCMIRSLCLLPLRVVLACPRDVQIRNRCGWKDGHEKMEPKDLS